MKAYKITYMRIGYNEPWAGWKIAGKSSELSSTISDEYFRIQSANSTSPVVTSMLETKTPIWEFLVSGKCIYISKLTYGFFDQSPESRPSMRADGIIFQTQESSEFQKMPYLALLISNNNFDNHPKIETLYPKIRDKNTSTVNLSQDDISTIYDTVEEVLPNVNICELVKEYFPDVLVLKTVIKCVLWAVSEKSNPSISLLYQGNDDDKKNIIYIISALLPIPLRNFVSFRTSSIGELKPLKFVFCEEKGTRYIDISTGENNIIKENKLDARYEKYNFINYPIDHIDDINAYFDYCYKVMDDLGDVTSTDLNYLKIVHDIVLDEFIDSCHVMDDMEILKKFLDFISIPINNKRIDWYCAKLLESIVDNNIPLNDQLKKRLQAKLKITQSEELKNVGYNYDVFNMVNSKNKENEFSFLVSLRRDNPEMFKIYREKIFNAPGGSNFLDQFYGNYSYFKDAISDSDLLIKFWQETEDLQVRYYIEKTIDEKCKMFGKCVSKKDYMNGEDIEHAYLQYKQLIEKLFSKESNKTKLYLLTVHEDFWRTFNLMDFRYKYRNIYLTFPVQTNRSFLFVKKLIDYFEQISKQENALPKQFKEYIQKSTSLSTNKEKKMLLREFQEGCVLLANCKRNLDFWYGVADLIHEEFVSFIIENDICVFIDADIFFEELEKSEQFSSQTKIDLLLSRFESYEYYPEEKQCINEIIRTIKEYQRTQKKEKKEREKQQKNIDRMLEKTNHLEKRNKKDSINSEESEDDEINDLISSLNPTEKKTGVAGIASKFLGRFRK